MNIEIKSVGGGALVASVEGRLVSICDANGERLRLPLGEVHYLARMTDGQAAGREARDLRPVRDDVMVPLRLSFSQERDVVAAPISGMPASTIWSEWVGEVSARVIVGDVIVEFDVGPDGCDSVVGPVFLSSADRDYLRRLRSTVDGLLGAARDDERRDTGGA